MTHNQKNCFLSLYVTGERTWALELSKAKLISHSTTIPSESYEHTESEPAYVQYSLLWRLNEMIYAKPCPLDLL